MIKKLEHFVASLSDQEIDRQLGDIFEQAKTYKELIEKEKAYRRECQLCNNSGLAINFGDSADICTDVGEDFNYAFSTNGAEEASIDFELAQMIQQKVSAFSAEKTKEQLEKLKQIPPYTVDPQDLAQLQYELEACELHLFELTGETSEGNIICLSCGEEIEPNAKFCGKCGAAVKGAQ